MTSTTFLFFLNMAFRALSHPANCIRVYMNEEKKKIKRALYVHQEKLLTSLNHLMIVSQLASGQNYFR